MSAADVQGKVGTAAVIAVTVTCTVSMADLAIPGLPGSHTLTGHATSPIDNYRSR